MVLGLGLQEPWRLVGQHLDTTKNIKNFSSRSLLNVAANVLALIVGKCALRMTLQRKNGGI
jgi:hypothetical protein